VYYIAADRKLRDWLEQRSQRVLLIDQTHVGDHPSVATSFIAAMVVETIRGSLAATNSTCVFPVALSYFCGEHSRSTSDPLFGPVGLVISFISQLVVGCEGLMVRRAFKEFQAVHSDNVRTLWKCSKSLYFSCRTTLY